MVTSDTLTKTHVLLWMVVTDDGERWANRGAGTDAFWSRDDPPDMKGKPYLKLVATSGGRHTTPWTTVGSTWM